MSIVGVQGLSNAGRRTEYDLAAVQDAYKLISRRFVVVDLEEL